jgi:hypothetical protein
VTTAVFLIFCLLLFGIPGLCLAGFLAMEYGALSESDDRFQTFSQYVKKWRRRHMPWAAYLIGVILSGFFLSAAALTAYLFGHFIWEAW